MAVGDKIALGCIIVFGVALVFLLIFRNKMNAFFNKNNEAYMKKQGQKQTSNGKKFLAAFLSENPQINESMIENMARNFAEHIVHGAPSASVNPQIVQRIQNNWQFHCIQTMKLEDIDPLDFANGILTMSANYADDTSKLFLSMKLGMFNGSLALYDCDLLDASERGF